MTRSAPDPSGPLTRLELRANGPIVVTGPCVVDGGAGDELHDGLFLCRCGQSASKPQCDGSHKRVGFTAPGVEPPRRS